MLSGLELKIKRITLGIKASELSKVLGCSNAFITYMEKGERKIPEDKYILWTDYLGL
ncbi:helix-turn-helix domain-containing protein [Bacillus sp. UMB0728]|uniref:helix-turn-helix domain-containing protein n=1 Tax=Bacillus sp. UMB0728 TaxID=2066052 RepID=UPI001156D74A|nr:helix-turn-helix transcriptional regulator [Bacillus sp. UMB0728]